MTTQVESALLALGLSVALCFALMPLARRLGWVDSPDERKQHDGNIPLAGGPAMFLAVVLAVTWGGGWQGSLVVLGWSSAFVFLIGLIDDRKHVNVALRFGLQITALMCMIYFGDVLLLNFGKLFWDRLLGLGPLAVPITVFSALGVINAFNMIDGIDGLSSSLALVALCGLAFLAGRGGFVAEHGLLLVVTAALLGFWMMNFRFSWRKRALVFMGDSGSSWLGFVLAWFFIALSQDDPANGVERAYAPITAVWLFGLPLMDTTYVMVRRIYLRQPVFGADTRHLHHLFLRSGFSVRQTWAAMTGIAVLLALAGIAGELANVPEWTRFYAYLALAFVYMMAVNRAWKSRRFLGRNVDPTG
jgi:UDP-GlcNAc:undecaprenyl-phosphate GlcNAc-1-phosphate transferase